MSETMDSLRSPQAYTCPYCGGEHFTHKRLSTRADVRAPIDRIGERAGAWAAPAVLVFDTLQATCDGCGYSVEYSRAVTP